MIRKTTEGMFGLCGEVTQVRGFKMLAGEVKVWKDGSEMPEGICRMSQNREILGCVQIYERSSLAENFGEKRRIMAEKILKRFRAHDYLCMANRGGGRILVGVCPFKVNLTPGSIDLEKVETPKKRGRGRPRKIQDL